MAARHKPAGRTREERDRLSLGVIESFLDSVVKGASHCPSCKQAFEIKSVDSSVINAARVRYDKLRPTLSAVEQTTVNPDDQLTEEQIMLKFRQLIDQYPELLAKLLGEKARISGVGVAAVPSEAHHGVPSKPDGVSHASDSPISSSIHPDAPQQDTLEQSERASSST